MQLFSNATRGCLAQKGDIKEIHELGCLIFFSHLAPMLVALLQREKEMKRLSDLIGFEAQ